MRLHTMTVTAFGPFARTENVDFDQLFSAGVFLLKGVTGAGKTSVLDAVCFALYGSVPGHRPTTRLRSDHAPDTLRTRVELQFSVSSRRFKIARTPVQNYRSTRAKDGTATAQATAQLHERITRPDGSTGWEPVSAHVQEASTQITTLLGLTKEQFCQVVLLPQGDFAKFLHASAGDRRALLSHLFTTHRFQDLQTWLATQRNTLRNDLQQAQATIDRLGGRIEQAAGPQLSEATPPPSAPNGTNLLPWAHDLLTRASAAHDTARAAEASTDQAHKAAKAALAAADDLAGRQQRHSEAVTRRTTLDQNRAHNQQLRTRLEHAHSAEHLRPLLAAVRAGASQLTAAQETESERRRLLDTAHTNATTPELEQAHQELHTTLGRLEALRPREERHTKLAHQLATLEEKENLAQEELDDAQNWLDSWPESRATATDRITALRSAAERVPQLAKEENALAQQLEMAETRDALATELEKATKAADKRDVQARAAQKTWLDLREQRLNGMAAELARDLQDGQPCTVCGSPEHPRPAQPSAQQPTRADEEKAAQAYEKAQKLQEAADQARTDLATRHAQAMGAAGSEPVTQLRTRLEQAHTVHTTVQHEAAELVEAQQNLEDLQAEHDRQDQQRTRAQQQVTESQSRAATLRQEQQQIIRELDGARADAPTLEHRITALTEDRDRVADVIEHARRTTAAATRYTDATATAHDSAAKAGFPTLEEATDALQPAPTIQQWQMELDQWDKDGAAVADLLTTPELVDASQLPPADPAAAQAAVTAAETAVKAATKSTYEAHTRATELRSLTGELAPAVETLERLRADHALADRLAEVANGRSTANTLSMELEAYVLASRLKEIAAAANTRLLNMTSERFLLVYSQDKDPGKGRAKAGLSLRILDNWTGLERETSTLSGGETFTTSLALALGLADIVTGEAGGRPLGVLFVDEGFGSLDEQSLTDVMDVLDQLRAGDRAVGVVSHVGDLSDRIPTQLHIRKERNGSTVQPVLADA
ncbi:SMC family ATPase [Streptomyces sp. BE303]|uniref:SMC family ATPase n=1 Tax=Streptomyces sp. BE303 TaxID=3002528 RepID=UPI002E76F860|nr:SMC family ATPase [Streptomyces sp. BE303]MED7949319.1 SMC family ATPase [Streptomyces sp. BE303]